MKKNRFKNKAIYFVLILILIIGTVFFLRASKEPATETTSTSDSSSLTFDNTSELLNLTEEENKLITSLKGKTVTYADYPNSKSELFFYNELSSYLGINFEPVKYDTFNECVTATMNGEVDLFGPVLYDSKNSDRLTYTPNLGKTPVVAIAKNLALIRENLKSHDSEKVIRIGSLPDTSFDSLIYEKNPSLNLKKSEMTFEEGMLALENGEIDVYVGDLSILYSFVGDAYESDKYSKLDFTFFDEDIISPPFVRIASQKGKNDLLISALGKIYLNTDIVSKTLTSINGERIGETKRYLSAILKDEELNSKIGTVKIGFSSDKNVTKEANRSFFTKVKDKILGNDAPQAEDPYAQYLEMVLGFLEIDYEYVPIDGDLYKNTSEIKDSVKKGELDLAYTFSTSGNNTEEGLLFSEGIEKQTVVYVATRDTVTSSTLNTFDKLMYYDIGVVKDTYFEKLTKSYINDSSKIKVYDTYEECFKALEDGEIISFVTSMTNYNKYVYSHSNSRLVATTLNNLESYTTMIFTDNETGAYVSNALNTTLRHIPLESLNVSNLLTSKELQDLYLSQNTNLQSYLLFSSVFFVLIILIVLAVQANNKHIANIDYLTKLLNRRTLYKTIDKLSDEYSIAYFDLDDFKYINDNYGHKAGDDALKYVASNLQKIGRSSKAFRIGGDEFILAYKTAEVDLKAELDKFFNKEITTDGVTVNVKGSVGTLDLSLANFDSNVVVELIDFAMLKSKRKGKNSITAIQPGDIEEFEFLNVQNIESYNSFIEKREALYSLSYSDVSNSAKKFNMFLPKVEYSINDNQFNYSNLALKLATLKNNEEAVENSTLMYLNFLKEIQTPFDEETRKSNIFVLPSFVLGLDVFDNYNLSEYLLDKDNFCFSFDRDSLKGKDIKKLLALYDEKKCKVGVFEFNFIPKLINAFDNFSIDFITLSSELLDSLVYDHITNAVISEEEIKQKNAYRMLVNLCNKYKVTLIIDEEHKKLFDTLLNDENYNSNLVLNNDFVSLETFKKSF